MARAKIPRPTFDYIAGGAEDEVSLRRNREAYAHWALRPRVLVDVSKRDTSTTVLGTRVSMPILVAPTSFHGLVHPEGEVATAKGAAAAGTLMAVSTIATKTLEEIAAAAPGPRWFQLYAYRDRRVTEDLLHRAANAGYRVICLAEDAKLAAEHGVAGIVVSNHGGRQLDSTLGTLDVLPEVVAAVKGRVEVYVDGGIRRGTDVLKALALGARAVLVGRPILWGLALGGADGVRAVLQHLQMELDTAIALAGRATVKEIDVSVVQRAA